MHVITKIVDAIKYKEEKVSLTEKEILEFRTNNPGQAYPIRVLKEIEKVVKKNVELKMAIYPNYTISQFINKKYKVDKKACLLDIQGDVSKIKGSFKELTQQKKIGYGTN